MGIAKIGIALLAVCLAATAWLGFVLVLNNSGIGFLRAVAFFFSNQTALGYGLFGLLSIWFFKLLEKWLLALAKSE